MWDLPKPEQTENASDLVILAHLYTKLLLYFRYHPFVPDIVAIGRKFNSVADLQYLLRANLIEKMRGSFLWMSWKCARFLQTRVIL